MLEGSVEVSGPMLAEAKSVRGKERLLVSVSEGRVEHLFGRATAEVLSTERESVDAAAGKLSVDEAIVSETQSSPAISEAVPSRKSAGKLMPEWQRLAATGRYDEALAAVHGATATRVLERGSVKALISLGETARYGGDLALARRAYLAVRNRFGGSPHASGAAYSLGVMAFSQSNGCKEAMRWFRVVAAERTSADNLAREASGRILECLSRTHDSAASAAARKYLAAYPEGPHAPLARKLAHK